jgi:hypothetical protein
VLIVDIKGEQQRRIRETISWAKRIRAELQNVIDAHRGQVHFRPSSTGVVMVGLLPERPQRGKSGLRDLPRVAADFENLFNEHCKDIEQGRPTKEKRLQSWLIRDAYTHGRKLAAMNVASTVTNEPVELVFITDEISLPLVSGKIDPREDGLRRGGIRVVGYTEDGDGRYRFRVGARP